MKYASIAARLRSSGFSLPASRLMRLFVGAMITAIAVIAAVPAVASQASGRSVVSRPLPRAFFGLGPANKHRIDGRPFFNWGSSPGGHFTDYVAIVNFGATAVTLHVFVSNAAITTNGVTSFLPPGKSVGGPASWVRISYPNNSPYLHLAPRSKVILKITGNIPQNASPGDHEGAVIAALTSIIQSKHHFRGHLVQQVADRILTRITGKLNPNLSVLDWHVSYKDPINPLASAPATLSFVIKNNGNAILGGKATVSVQGLLGSTETAKVPITVPILQPGSSDHLSATITGVYPEFWMTAKVTIQPLVVEGQSDTGLTTYTGQAGFFAVPYIPFGIIILLVAGVVAVWLRRRRRRRASVQSSPPRTRGRALADR